MGTYDLKDNSLITLKEASMEEVRRRNEPKLVAKATILRDLVRYSYTSMDRHLLPEGEQADQPGQERGGDGAAPRRGEDRAAPPLGGGPARHPQVHCLKLKRPLQCKMYI